MCRIGAIKSADPVHASKALSLMLPQQEGHDNSGFAMVMQDLAHTKINHCYRWLVRKKGLKLYRIIWTKVVFGLCMNGFQR